MNTIQSRIQHKRDTSSNWEQNNPIILAGEIIIVDTNSGERRTKTGDGIKRYNELPFDDEIIRNLVSSKDAETLQSAKQYTDDKVGDIDLSNMVVATGGGSIQPDGSIGSGPFVITMDEDNDAELSASAVGYSNSSSGLTSNNVQSAIDEVSENVNGKIAKVSGASTGHLPTFSSDGELQDSGKSLDDLGNNDFVVTITGSSAEGPFTADQQYADIVAAIAAEKNVFASWDAGSKKYPCIPLTISPVSSNPSGILAFTTFDLSYGVGPVAFTISSANAVTGFIQSQHTHTSVNITDTIPVAKGGTGVTSLTGTDYNTSRVRGIALLSSTPSSIPNGCLVGVYE